jgi:hypothetical protein
MTVTALAAGGSPAAASMLVMQSLGGGMRAGDAEQRAVNTLALGPAGGVVAARRLGSRLGQPSVIYATQLGTRILELDRRCINCIQTFCSSLRSALTGLWDTFRDTHPGQA